MNFQDAIKSGFTKYATFPGRASRSEYWLWMLFVFLTSAVCHVVDVGLLGISDPKSLHPLSAIFSLAVFVPGLALLWIGGFAFDLGHATLWHSLFVVAGGTCVSLAHIVNLRIAREPQRCDCVTPA